VGQPAFSQAQFNGLLKSLDFTKNAVKSFSELVEKNRFILQERPIFLDPDIEERIEDFPLNVLKILTPQLQNVRWDRNYLEELLNLVCEQIELKFRDVAPILRAALAGSSKTPSVFDMMIVLGRTETIERLIEFEDTYKN
jgi:glutamyl-tRNA synthetase